jgi:ribosome recycling factor
MPGHDEAMKAIQADAHKRMDTSVEVVKKELGAVRTGRAHSEILAPVLVNYYGTTTPLHQLATVNVPESQLLVVTVFDRSQVKEVEKAIQAAGLGLNPMAEGNVIRVPVPALTEERRKEMVKRVHKLGEDGKVAIRNVRREANDKLIKMEKSKELSKDEHKTAQDKVQMETDNHIKAIDELMQKKEKELMHV